MSDRLDIKRQALRRTSLFNSLTETEMDKLIALSKLMTLPPGSVLFMKGDPGDRLFVVIKGIVRISTVSIEGRETTLNLIGSGQMFGEIAVLDGGDRTADAVTVDATELLAIDRRDLLTFLESNPRCCFRMLAACADRLRWVSGLLEDANFLDLPARLAKRLLLLARTFGRPVTEGIRIDLRLSQQDLATHMNVTRESVNKLIHSWELEGFVQTGRGWVVVRDEDALADLADVEG